MTRHIERLKECDAMHVDGDNAADVVDWLGGPDKAMALPDGSVLFRVGNVWLTAEVGQYVVAQWNSLNAIDADDFERDWEAGEGE